VLERSIPLFWLACSMSLSSERELQSYLFGELWWLSRQAQSIRAPSWIAGWRVKVKSTVNTGLLARAITRPREPSSRQPGRLPKALGGDARRASASRSKQLPSFNNRRPVRVLESECGGGLIGASRHGLRLSLPLPPPRSLAEPSLWRQAGPWALAGWWRGEEDKHVVMFAVLSNTADRELRNMLRLARRS